MGDVVTMLGPAIVAEVEVGDDDVVIIECDFDLFDEDRVRVQDMWREALERKTAMVLDAGMRIKIVRNVRKAGGYT